MDDLKKILKSVLISSAARLQAYQLNEDFKLYVGKNIPFEEYGYGSLLEFLKSLSDVLIVHGNDLFSTVELKFPPPVNKRSKWKRKRKKKNVPVSENVVTSNTTREVKLPKNPVSPTIDPNNRVSSDTRNKMSVQYSCSSGININMRIDHRDQKMRMATEIDYERIASIKRKFAMPQILEEAKEEIEIGKKGRQQLRYPKTLMTLEKNGEKFDVTPFQISEAGSRSSDHLGKISALDGEANKSRLLERIRNRGNISRRLTHIPSKRTGSSIPTEKLVDLADDFSKFMNQEVNLGMSNPKSIMDEPLPPSIPEVSKEFVKPKSEDLIDFDDDVHIPLPLSAVIPPLRSLPFMEVIKLVKNLEISSKQ